MNPVLYHQGKFPPADLDWVRLLPLIGPANAAVARYEGVLLGVPNPDVLLAPLSSQEAVLSSRIEGTQATLGEVLEFEAGEGPRDESTPRQADIHEVLNYRAALREAARLLNTLPLSQRLIKETHTVLMRGVRGRNKAPGEYRRIPNWIGRLAPPSKPRGSSPVAPMSCPRRWTPGSNIFTRRRPICWSNWRSSTRSSRPFTPSWTEMGASAA